MRLFLVKCATFFVIVIVTVNVEFCFGHVIYKKIYNANDKVMKIFPVPSKIIKINTKHLPNVNSSKSATNKTASSKYAIKSNLNKAGSNEIDEGKFYEMISTSNKTNFTENRFFSDRNDKSHVPDSMKADTIDQTNLNIPLFLPYLFENDKLNVEDINGYLNDRYYTNGKHIKPFLNGVKNLTGNECELKSDILTNGIKYLKPQKFTNSFETKDKNEKLDLESDSLSKLAKFLGLFTVVQFTNEICSDGSENVYGTCYHYIECNRLGGISKGSCAQGHGVCCYVEQTCGQRTNAKATYFLGGPFFNTSEPGVYGCSLIVEKFDPTVKQIRLDFVDFQTAGPLNGNCQIDRFIVSGQNDNNILPEFCGVNNGQHMYIDVGDVPGPIMLAVLSSGAKGLPMKFKIHVQQLRERSEISAPENCLQYYLSASGVLKSFNYQDIDSSDVQLGYMNNLNYAICIKKQPGYCGITYSNVADDGTDMSFELSNIDDDGVPTVPEGEAGAESYNCPDDYLVLNNMRLCGYRLNDASENSNLRENHMVKVADNGPFIVNFKTNRNLTGRGFYLTYQQIPCIVN